MRASGRVQEVSKRYWSAHVLSENVTRSIALYAPLIIERQCVQYVQLYVHSVQCQRSLLRVWRSPQTVTPRGVYI